MGITQGAGSPSLSVTHSPQNTSYKALGQVELLAPFIPL